MQGFIQGGGVLSTFYPPTVLIGVLTVSSCEPLPSPCDPPPSVLALPPSPPEWHPNMQSVACGTHCVAAADAGTAHQFLREKQGANV